VLKETPKKQRATGRPGCLAPGTGYWEKRQGRPPPTDEIGEGLPVSLGRWIQRYERVWDF
jgi:hypothetical protein